MILTRRPVNRMLKVIMGRRTLKTPTKDDTFLWRICHALDLHPTELADAIGVSYRKDLRPLLAHKHRTVEIDRDATWLALNDYVNERIAMLMAVRLEMNRTLKRDIDSRIARYDRFKARITEE